MEKNSKKKELSKISIKNKFLKFIEKDSKKIENFSKISKEKNPKICGKKF